MRSIDKTSADLFQKLRARYTPVTLGNESAESTSDPAEARFFNFVYSEGGTSRGPITISLVDNRAMKVFYSDDIVDQIENKDEWYGFLRELRNFAKRNLLMFDARDISKSQLDTRDFGWLSKVDKTMDHSDITVSESTMWGSKRRSYQALESVKMIVQHTKSVDETVPGARSRSIQAIYLERNDGERYKFPYNYLTGARAMARHITEGGTPYDPLGQHILSTIKEMRDLSKFARMTKNHALEDGSADEVRQRVVERFRGLKSTLGAISGTAGYNQFKESFQPAINEEEGQNLEDLRERFTRKIWDNKMEELLPAVVRALESAEITEASGSVEKQIRDMNRLIVLKRDPNADSMIRNTKFNNAIGLMGFVLSDIATRAIGDDMDPLANFASDVAERINDRALDPKDKELGMLLAKRYIDDIKKMATDPEYAAMVRKDPDEVYGKKKKRTGGFHEAEAFENWVNDVDESDVDESDEVDEGELNEARGYDIANGLVKQFQADTGVTGPATHLLQVSNPGFRVWTRGDGTRYRDPGKIEPWERNPEGAEQQKAFWSWLIKQPGIKNVGKVSGWGASTGSTDVYTYKGLYFTLNNGRIEWGSASRFKNPRSVWKHTPNDQEESVQEAGFNDDGSYNTSDDEANEFDDYESDQEEVSPVYGAIIHRIMRQRLDLLSKYGPEKVMDAVEEVADFVGDVDEVGSSDVSGWIKHVEQMLGNMDEAAVNELQALSGITRVDPRDPNAITKTALAKQGITTGADPKTGAMTVGKGVNKQQVLSILKGITAKSKGKINPAVVMNDQPNQGEPVMEKEIRITDDSDQDDDGDTDFADVMIARRVKSGEPKDKAIASTKNKTYNEFDMNESALVDGSLALLKKLSGI